MALGMSRMIDMAEATGRSDGTQQRGHAIPRLAGFRQIEVKPVIDGPVKRAGADYGSVLGRISVNWQQLGGGVFLLDLVVAPNAVASVHLPAKAGEVVREGRALLTDKSAAKLVSRDNNRAVLEVGSGSYRVEVQD